MEIVAIDRPDIVGYYSKANVYEGPIIDYLGMPFDFSLPGKYQ